jgi:hypothetical protein
MLTSSPKRFILPFSTQKSSASEVVAAAVFAVAEQQRSKGGGLIGRQPEEKLVFLSKIGYPIWVFPKNNSLFIFDGLGDSSYSVSYTDLPSAKALIESLEINSKQRENYTAFLLDNGSYFQQALKEKQFVFRGLISDLDFKNEFNVYRKEATEIPSQTNIGLLLPTLEENTVSSMLTEFDILRSFMREEAERLSECLRLINKTTSQYITEIDYEAAAVKEETEAKIRAQEELVNPEIAKLNKEYRGKIKDLTGSFDKELESLGKLKAKTKKFIEDTEGKIRLYIREAKAHSLKKHAIYEKRWKEKNKQAQKELNGLKKELKNIEGNFNKLSKQKGKEISKLNFELDAEIKFARQPLVELQAARDAKMLVFKQETEKLLNQEKPVIEDLSKSIRLRETIKANFELLGISDQGLKGPALFYATFSVACYEIELSRRYLIIPPSTIANFDFSAKLKGVLGMSKIKDMLVPRFKALASLIGAVQVLAKQNTVFEDQLYVLSKRNNLLTNSLFLENVKKGLVYLTHEGWLSEREHQVLSNRLTFNN